MTDPKIAQAERKVNRTEETALSAEREVPDILDDVGMGPAPMAQIDPRAELQKFEAAAELLAKLVPASIRRTRAQDWVKMGDKVYLQATGVERISGLWGLVFGEYVVEREDYDDGEFAYVVIGPIGCRRTGVFYRSITGGRSSRDRFFDEFDTERPRNWQEMDSATKETWRHTHRIRPDRLEVRKAATSNWMTRGASMLTGLRGLTEADLQREGITGIRSVEFGTGAKGGATVPADLAAKRTELRNDILRRVGGDTEAAQQLLVELTKGKDFSGFKSTDRMTQDWQVDNAFEKLRKHSTFGDAAKGKAGERQAGDE